MRRLLALLLAFAGFVGSVRAADVEAIVVALGDMHSAYDRTAQFVAHVERLRTENPGVPLAVLIDGDTFELGNAVARRSEGAVELAMLAALAKRGPVVLNLGNHEPDLFDPVDAVARLQRAGVTVLGGNVRNLSTGQPLAPATARIKLGAHEATLVGLTTDRLSTFRAAIRPMLDLTDPVTWAKQNLAAALKDAALPIVMTHTGLKADREILPLVPDGTLFVAAHDHLRFVHRLGRTVYFHSGSWTEFVSVARLRRQGGTLRWDVEQLPIDPAGPADPTLAALVRDALQRHLTAEEKEIVGRSPRALGPTDAALFAVEAARAAAGADAAVIGGTTFGAGLPAGEVSRFAFDACVRFDGPLYVAEVDGAWLQKLLARCNQGPDTPFAERAGENLAAVGPATIEPGKRYRFVTTDWIARNAQNYLGENPPALVELPRLKLKAAVIAVLEKP